MPNVARTHHRPGRCPNTRRKKHRKTSSCTLQMQRATRSRCPCRAHISAMASHSPFTGRKITHVQVGSRAWPKYSRSEDGRTPKRSGQNARNATVNTPTAACAASYSTSPILGALPPSLSAWLPYMGTASSCYQNSILNLSPSSSAGEWQNGLTKSFLNRRGRLNSERTLRLHSIVCVWRTFESELICCKKIEEM
jgi:hypothetical protein